MPHTLPLADAGAQYSHDGGKTWKTVLPRYGIANATLAQLAPCWWAGNAIWRIHGRLYTSATDLHDQTTPPPSP